MRAARLLFWLLLLGVVTPGLLLSPAPAYADDDDAYEDDDDEFETQWIGARLGAWYRPDMNMDVQVNGPDAANPLIALIGTQFDIKRDLGVKENVTSEYATDFDREAIPELEIFMDTDWISFRFWLIPPFEYRGETNVTRSISFGGMTFSATTPVKSKFEQFFTGFEVAINIFNNRFFKLAPVAGIQAFGVDWELEAPMLGLRADTSDIYSPAQLEGFQVFPYPVIGADVRVGYRDYIEAGVKVTGIYLDYLDLYGNTYRVEAFATAYPIPWIGITVGARQMVFDVKKQGTDLDPEDSDFDFDLDYTGFFASLTVRF